MITKVVKGKVMVVNQYGKLVTPLVVLMHFTPEEGGIQYMSCF